MRSHDRGKKDDCVAGYLTRELLAALDNVIDGRLPYPAVAQAEHRKNGIYGTGSRNPGDELPASRFSF